MKQYKHIPTGKIYTQGTSVYDYLYCNVGEKIPFEIVSSGKDWEEITKEWEITAFECGDSIYGLMNNGNYLNNNIKERNGGACLKSLLSTTIFNIYSVKRLFDGKMFTINDNTNFGIIKSFHILGEYMRADVTNKTAPTITQLEKVEQALFTTEDGVDIFEGNKFWRNVGFFTTSEEIANKTTRLPLADRSHSTKEKAEEYILMNKPCLSLNDLNEIGALTNHNEVKLKELVKNK